MDIICIDDIFPTSQLEHYRKHGVVTPISGKIYSIRELIINMIGGKGFRLNEILNPDIPLVHPVLGKVMVEPNWAARRFTNLLGEPLTEEKLRKIQKEVNIPIIQQIENNNAN